MQRSDWPLFRRQTPLPPPLPSPPEAEVVRLRLSRKMAAAAPGPVDELVSSVTLYRRRPRLLHGTVLPFVAGLYPAWLWLWGPRVWAAWGEAAEEEEGPAAGPRPALPEAALLALAAIGVVHLLTALSGLWSVHAHCALTCVRVSPGAAGSAAPRGVRGSSRAVPPAAHGLPAGWELLRARGRSGFTGGAGKVP